MRLFNLDLHISVIADVEHVFKKLFPDAEITKWSISGHTWVFNRQRDNVRVVNEKTWLDFDLNLVDQFHHCYGNMLQHFDGFIVTHSPVFALLYEKFGKPIFMVNSTRYEMPYCWRPNADMRTYLEKQLKSMSDTGQLIPVSNNKADQAYIRLGAGVVSEHIPSLCLYTEADYQPAHDEFVVFNDGQFPSIPNTMHHKALGRYSWKELYQYRGIVHMPYDVSTMSVFEQYSANVPLFFPTKRFLKEQIQKETINFNGPYSRQDYAPRLTAAVGPNWVDFWLDRADYYDTDNMKYITYFDNFEDLKEILATVDTDAISNDMTAWNYQRQRAALEKWKELIDKSYQPAHFKMIDGVGQINMQSQLGQKLLEIALNPRFQTYLEIGSWNGEGSTVCLMNGLMQRQDGSTLYSIEVDQDMHHRACQFWSWVRQSQYADRLHLIHGRITNNGLMSPSDIESHSLFPLVKEHYKLHYENDVNNYQSAKNIYHQLPESIDVVVLDGGEFSTEAEYRLIYEDKSPKVVVLDDTRAIKCNAIREELLNDANWRVYYDNTEARNGESIFIRNEELESF